MKLLLDEMYPPSLARSLGRAGINAVTAAELGLAGRSDFDLFAEGVAEDRVLLTENVADFVQLVGDHLGSGQHCPGLLLALSTRFSRRPAGHQQLVAAVLAVANDPLEDRVVYLERPEESH